MSNYLHLTTWSFPNTPLKNTFVHRNKKDMRIEGSWILTDGINDMVGSMNSSDNRVSTTLSYENFL